MSGKITVVGLGPGSLDLIAPRVLSAIREADAVIGYNYYIRLIEHFIPEHVLLIDSGMKKERDRAKRAFTLALEGMNVVVVSSGDAGVYGMAPLVMEMSQKKDYDNVAVSIQPGISAFQAAAAKLGAPTGHDFCVISLSDLLTPWNVIEQRIRAAASADFVTAVYNPKSNGRYWQIYRLKELFLAERSGDTPVGIVRHAERDNESIVITTLSDFDPETLDMFSVMIIGNRQTFAEGCRMITPRGYFSPGATGSMSVGQSIMSNSFSAIEKRLKRSGYAYDTKWAMMHAIHTTADFDFEDILYTTPRAVEQLHEKLTAGGATIITDVTMVRSGFRKAAVERYGIEVICYLDDPRVQSLASDQGITRTQAGMRLAVEEHPDALYVVGNAPTALIELSDLLCRKRYSPMGIIGAPVGFVNVIESKLRLKAVIGKIPAVIIEGRKGGSTVAATIVNAALSLDDAETMMPGRDV